MARSDFQAETTVLERGVIRVSLLGEVDLAVATEFQQALDDLLGAGHTKLLIDLSDTRFIDSTALGVLLRTSRQLRRRRGRLAVLCPKPEMRSLFELVGHNLIFPVDETPEKALGHLGAGRRFRRRGVTARLSSGLPPPP